MYRNAKLLFAALVVTAIAALGIEAGCHRGDSFPKRVLVFGIDGGTWNVINDMFAAGQLPNLKKLYDSGIHGVLESRPPILSPVVWSTIFTGRPWQEHGVQDWKTSQSSNRKVKAVWHVTSQLGLQTYVANVPSTWPPEEIRGEMVSGFPLSGSTIGGNTGEVVTRDGLTRPGLPPVYQLNEQRIREQMERLQVGAWSDWFDVEVRGRPNWRAKMRVLHFEDDRYYLTPVYRTDPELVITYPKALHAELDQKLGKAYVPEGPGWSRHAEEDTPKYLYDHLLQIARIQTDAAAMLASRPWDLFIYVDTLVDRVSHPYWSYMRPADYEGVDPAKASRYADVVRASYREADTELGQVLDAAKEPYWVVIVSDHGFQSSQDRKTLIGTHAFDGMYLVSAPGLAASEGNRQFIEDVAPTILYLLGKPVPADMKGKVMTSVAEVAKRPIEQVASYEDGVQRGSDRPVDAKTWEQLKGLGYVEGAPPRRPQPNAANQPAKGARPAGQAAKPLGQPAKPTAPQGQGAAQPAPVPPPAAQQNSPR